MLYESTSVSLNIARQALLALPDSSPRLSKQDDLPSPEWNNTLTDFPGERCIHELIEAQAERFPQGIAVRCAGEQITYLELNQQANQLAHYLQRRGVKPEVLVGLCMERSIELLIGLLAILKAGGAYVPLDPAYPKERLEFMVADAQLSVLLTCHQLAPHLPSTPLLICVDTDRQVIEQESTDNPTNQALASNLAYVIYTSGSTGKPKGVMIPHRSVVNHSTAFATRFEIQPGDNVLQFASLSFDVAAEEIFPAWFSGAAIVMRASQDMPAFADLLQAAQKERLTILNLPTAYWHALVAWMGTATPALPPSLRLVIVGGEQALPHFLARWQQQTGVRWVNAYGPTEATITATIYEPTLPNSDQECAPVPIGRPAANTEMYLLDAHLQPVSVGTPGEMYIGGEGVGRGYLGRPDLTAERFVPHPFSASPGARLYKTGDLGRYLPNGAIEYLGRIDRQVKIRGFRIELEEIERRLSQHPDVQACAVLKRDDASGDSYLVAYLASGNAQLASAELRRYLQERLPDYMVPAFFVVMEMLPLTPSGKADTHALPATERSQLGTSADYEAPRTWLEEQLAHIWSHVLKRPQISRQDHFFELGGHSLLAIQVISRIRDVFGIEIPARTLFAAPRLAQLAREVEQLLTTGQSVSGLAIPPRPPDGLLPLSFAQQRLWFFDRLAPESPLYNLGSAVRLNGPLDVSALECSLNALAQRHESLRTSFPTTAGHPTQAIASTCLIPLRVVQLEEGTVAEKEARVHELAIAELQRPFDLAQGPLIRAALFRLEAREHILLIALHHIIADAWSFSVLFNELATLYRAYALEQSPSLPRLPMQYADFTLWQQNWLQGERLQKHLEYWQRRLQGAPTLLELPGDHPRPPIQSYQGAHSSFVLPAELTEALKTLSRQEQATLFMTLLAGFKALLYRYTHQTDLVIGFPVAGRTRSDIEELIGFFVNTLVLRSDLAGNPRFVDLLQRVREGVLEASAHQELPFERLVEALQPERSLSYTPLCQVLFAFQNAPLPAFDLPDVQARWLEVETNTTRFDLTLSLEERNQELVGTWEYSSALFEAATIERMSKQFRKLLESIVAAPEERIADLALLPAAEEQQILVEWNDTARLYPREQSIHQLFEQQVERTPDAVAVRYHDEELTYQELHESANQLAHYLQQLGVGPETRVGLFLDRSVELVMGWLAVLKAGGVYVPLDPAYPKERLAFMLSDASIRTLLTKAFLLSKLPEHQAMPICMETEKPAITAFPRTTPTSKISADHLAYIIYTSGSTGRPKGVMLTHGGLRNLAHAQSLLFHMQPGDRILQFSSLSFDASVWEMTMALTTGATLSLATQEELRPGPPLLRLLNEQSISTVTLPPTALAVLSPQGDLALPQTLITAGEACSVELVSHWARGRRFFNAYGPTETTVCATASQCSADQTPISIGRPIANTQVYILDQRLHPVPIGVPGELYIGGDGLARGYLHRPDLTAERFLPDPFNAKPGSRLYKTGDLARYLPDGNVEFLGRLDHQVKLRGFRIELGEIEAILQQHPQVQEALVLAREDTPGDKRLVAYLVSTAGEAPETQALRAFLQARLPPYMLPASFVFLDALPLMPNGKVDRKALPAPVTARPERGEDYEITLSPTEQRLAAIWTSLLGVQRVGRNENFFELGGHSLLAASVLAQVNAAFQVDLPLSSVFEHPTVAALAAEIKRLLLLRIKEMSEEVAQRHLGA